MRKISELVVDYVVGLSMVGIVLYASAHKDILLALDALALYIPFLAFRMYKSDSNFPESC